MILVESRECHVSFDFRARFSQVISTVWITALSRNFSDDQMGSLRANQSIMSNAKTPPLRFPTLEDRVSDFDTATTLYPFAFGQPIEDEIKNASILVVDDEVSVTQIIKYQLREFGFRNIKIQSESISSVSEITEASPDLILLDIDMKPVSGFLVLQMMRADERTHHIPVIVLTALDDEKTRVAALNLGANDVISKPASVSELVARVHNTLATKVYRDQNIDFALRLKSDVLIDPPTGIANRLAFEFEVKRRVLEFNRTQNPLTLLLIELTNLAWLQAEFDSRTLDSVLKQFAAELSKIVRGSDLVARIDHHQFGVVLPSSSSYLTKHVVLRAQQIIAKQEFQVGEETVSLRGKVTIESMNSEDDDAAAFVDRVERSLRRSEQVTVVESNVELDAIVPDPTASEAGETYNKSPEISALRNARIAIVDDEPATVALAKKYLESGGFKNFICVVDSAEAVDRIRRERADVVLLDLRMPGIDGFDILQAIRRDERNQNVPILFFSADSDDANKIKALNMGATDYLKKPINECELLARVRNSLLAKFHLDDLSNHSQELERAVRNRTKHLAMSRRESLLSLARAAELRDKHIMNHVIRVGRYSAVIANELGFGEERTEFLELAAQLHDVGKIGIKESIVENPGKLTDQEFEMMQQHCAAGADVLRRGQPEQTLSPVMQMAAIIAESHHEKWNGSGYPKGLQGEAIPIEARIVALADVFDALGSERPYRKPMDLEECVKFIVHSRGTHFDPKVVDAFLRRRSEIEAIRRELPDIGTDNSDESDES